MRAAVIFWSGTGNTELMAGAVADGLKAAGAEVDVLQVSDVTPSDVKNYDVVALGCPAMGDEVLEEGEFEPFYQEAERYLAGKNVALFGSYSWNEGQWMVDWAERASGAGLRVAGGKGLAIYEAPDADGVTACNELGKTLAAM